MAQGQPRFPSACEDVPVEQIWSSSFPPPLKPGDCIAVVAPSSPFPAEEFWRGLGWLRDRYRIVAHATVLGRDGFLAGDDAGRARGLAEAMTAEGVKAIVAARGGYGAMRIVERLPWDELSRSPRWIVGFSDVTALHADGCGRERRVDPRAERDGARARRSPGRARAWLRGARAADARESSGRGLEVMRAGSADGPLVGGNLALLEAMAAAGRLQVPEGAVLFLEDVDERPYRVDRMLTSLPSGGAPRAPVGGGRRGADARCEAAARRRDGGGGGGGADARSRDPPVVALARRSVTARATTPSRSARARASRPGGSSLGRSLSSAGARRRDRARLRLLALLGRLLLGRFSSVVRRTRCRRRRRPRPRPRSGPRDRRRGPRRSRAGGGRRACRSR